MGTIPETPAAIGLGANLGERLNILAGATIALASLPHTRLVARGPVVQSPPLEPPSPQGAPAAHTPALGGPYLNSAVLLATKLAPLELLVELHRIEKLFGRDRAGETARWMPRTLDLDMLLFSDQVIQTPALTVPHPRLAERWFVLEPLVAIWPDAIVPGTGLRVSELLARVAPPKPPAPAAASPVTESS